MEGGGGGELPARRQDSSDKPVACLRPGAPVVAAWSEEAAKWNVWQRRDNLQLCEGPGATLFFFNHVTASLSFFLNLRQTSCVPPTRSGTHDGGGISSPSWLPHLERTRLSQRPIMTFWTKLVKRNTGTAD